MNRIRLFYTARSASWLVLVAVAAMATRVEATIIATEDFTGYSTTTANPGAGGYPAGRLDTQGGVVNGFGGAWGDPAPVLSNFATGLLYNYAAPTPFNEDLTYANYVGGGGTFVEMSNYTTYYQNNRLLSSPVSSGTLYWSFLVNFQSAAAGVMSTAIVGSGGAVVIGNYASSGTAMQAYNVSGLAGGTAPIVAGTDNLVVVRVDFDQSATLDRVRFYMNPNLSLAEGANVPLLDATTTNVGSISRIQLAQYGAGSRAFYDGIRLATAWSDLVVNVPEPSSLAMLLFGAMGMFLFARKRG